jgi:pimeloyl-ACP methyl ester carboxylesterase
MTLVASGAGEPPDAPPTAMPDPTTSPTGAAPAWFRRAVAAAPQHHEVEADGATIRYRAWGAPQHPGVVLVHGGGAHAGWWDHVAPQLSGHRVVALDLSGHGDSDHRDAYDMSQWGREVMAVATADDLTKPVVVGHSMGGWIAATAAVEHGDSVAALVLIDSPLSSRPPDEERLRKRRAPHRIYRTRAAAVERFSTTPNQELLLPYVREHIAEQSVREVADGWTWKFDPGFYGRFLPDRTFLQQLGCPTSLLRSEHGLVSAQMAADMAGNIDGPFPVIDIPDAGHHPMLDQPLALLAGLRTLFALWP